MKTQFIFLILTLTTSPLTAMATSCQVSQESCDYYLCAEQKLSCGENGYLLHFGHQLCEVYLEQEASSSPSLQAWYPRVRQCLQQALERMPEPDSCSTLSTQAFATHEDCYINTGFCSLPLADQFEVWHLAGNAAFTPDSLLVSMRVLARCAEGR